MLGKIFTFSRFTLFVALSISAIAAWYSVLGLTAIFAGAVIPIIIMGGILEIAKITTTVWLHRYWSKAGLAIKTYLTAAVIVLACLTSMGIFGLLSKAHLDQNIPSGDISAKVNLIDEKIKTQRDNIEIARKALAQMDAQVEQRLSRGDTEAGAERAVQIRRQQAGERSKLLKDISDAQKEIAKLNEERAPIASQLRKVEAEVGRVIYIAALIYGDNPDITLLEKAVRWVIILIVVVFDPLAIVLILAANNSLKWERENQLLKNADVGQNITTTSEPTQEQNVEPAKEEIEVSDNKSEPATDEPEENNEKVIDDPIVGETEEWSNKISTIENSTAWPFPDPEKENVDAVVNVIKQPNFTPKEIEALTKFIHENLLINREFEIQKDVVKTVDEVVTIVSPEETEPEIQEDFIKTVDEVVTTVSPEETESNQIEKLELENKSEKEIETTGVTTEIYVQSVENEYVEFDGKSMSIEALKNLHPELVIQESAAKNEILFGNKFPAVAKKSDIYTRTDIIPHKVYKFNGGKWLEINKELNSSYLQNTAYIQHLISKLDSGEYDPEFLTSAEQEEISEYLKRTT